MERLSLSSFRSMKLTSFLIRVFKRWFRHDGPGQSAAVSFYAIFTMAPLLVFSVVVSSKMLGPEKARATAVQWLSDMVPQEAAESLVSIVHVKFLADGPWWSNVISGAVLFWAASLIFVRLVYGTRAMFAEELDHERSVLHKNLIGRVIALSFAVTAGLVICLVFLVSSLLAPFLRELPFGTQSVVGVGNAFILAIGGVTLMRVVPFHRPRLKALAIVALFLIIAFFIGRALFQIYIAHSAIASAYGVASSVVVFIVWIFYLSSGYFLGAAICAELSQDSFHDSE